MTVTAKWDLVVVGAGTAGIPAAIFGARRGLRVLAVEKSSQIGGTLYLSGGQMSAAGTRHQQRHGVKDTPEEHFRDVMAFSEGKANRDLVRLATGNAAGTIDWLDDLGFDFSPECPAPTVHYHHNPYSKARMHWGTRAGYSILDLVVPEFESLVSDGSLDVALNTSLVGLDRNGDGGWGVRLRGPDGEREHTSRAVALTAGGYTANPAMFREVSRGRLVSPGLTTVTGDAHRIVTGLEGTVRNGESWLPTFGGIEDPDEPHRAIHTDYWAALTPQMRPPWEVYVNRSGKRFMSEEEGDEVTRGRALRAQEGQVFWVVFDEAILDRAPPILPAWGTDGIRSRAGDEPPVFRGDSLEDLASAAGIDPAGLELTVSEYNTAVGGVPDELGRRHLPLPIVDPPFYAVENHATTLRTPGGVTVDGRLRVVDADGRPFGGLYAAGEVLGSAVFSGGGAAAGMSITPAMTFGRLLGSSLVS